MKLLRRSALNAGACVGCDHVGMKQKARSIQYTLRGVPPEVDRILRRKAAQRRQSLNQVVLMK
jgi:predicted HicB family RNase H-like nuclease